MATKKQQQADQVLDIETLHLDPANVRRRTERNRAALDAALARFGPARSIVVDGKGVVRAGNGTLEAARAAGVKKVRVIEASGDELIAVRRADWSATEATAYAIADNRTAELAE
jgi:ParB-like chromosome segregation protein Spo0J